MLYKILYNSCLSYWHLYHILVLYIIKRIYVFCCILFSFDLKGWIPHRPTGLSYTRRDLHPPLLPPPPKKNCWRTAFTSWICGYYHSYVKNVSVISKHLHDLLKKDYANSNKQKPKGSKYNKNCQLDSRTPIFSLTQNWDKMGYMACKL